MEISNESYKSNDDEDRTTSDTDPTLRHDSIQSFEQSSVQSPKQSSEEVAEQSPHQSLEQAIEPTSSSTQEVIGTVSPAQFAAQEPSARGRNSCTTSP